MNLADVIRAALRSQAADLHVSIPAEVTSVDLAKGQVTARPLVKERLGDDVLPPPEIHNVPVVWPGAGGMRITFPIAAGDTVLLVFSDRSLDRWLSSGGEVDPLDERRHALSDAVAIPGLRSFKDAWAGAAADGVTIGAQGGPFQPAALGTSIRAELDALWAALEDLGPHTHISAAPGQPTGPATAGTIPWGPGVPPATLYGEQGKQTVESDTVKVSE